MSGDDCPQPLDFIGRPRARSTGRIVGQGFVPPREIPEVLYGLNFGVVWVGHWFFLE